MDKPTPPSTFDIFEGIDEADRSYAEEVVNADPVFGTPSPTTVRGLIKLPEKTTLEMLPPSVAEPVRAKLKAMSPAAAEANMQRLINEAVYKGALDARIAGGLGEHATPYHRLVFSQARTSRDMINEHLKIAQELAEVARWDAVQNPETGAYEGKEVKKITGSRRAGMEQRMREIEYQLKRLDEEEPFARREALKATIAERNTINAQVEEAAEAERRAEDKLREERIETAAKAKANVRRNRV